MMIELEKCSNCNKLTPKWLLQPIEGNFKECPLNSPSCAICWREFLKNTESKHTKTIYGPVSTHMYNMTVRFREQHPSV